MSRAEVGALSPGARLRAQGGSVAALSRGPWGSLSLHYTRKAALLSGYGDLLVRVSPGAAMGGFGVCWPAQRRIEINADLLGEDSTDLSARLAVLEGVFRHEVGHAEHTRYGDAQLPAQGNLREVVTLLEEIRMESHLVASRPADAPWIRAAAAVTFMEPPEHAGDALAGGWLACMTEGRVVAGTLQPGDTPAVRSLLAELLTTDQFAALDDLWPRVCAVRDGDVESLTALAREFLAILGVDEEGEGPAEGAGASGDEGEGAGGRGSSVAESVREALAESLAAAGASAECAVSEGDELLAAAAVEAGAESESRAHGMSVGSRVPRLHRRPATADERRARQDIAARLRRARVRDRHVTTRTSARPGGRLVARGAIKAASEKQRGALPTAEPWRHRHRRHVESPRVRVAAMVDASGSMRGQIDVACGSLWALANAVVDAGGEVVAAAFGETAVALPTTPRMLQHVTVSDADGGFEAAGDALDLLAGGFGPWVGPKLLVIVSDGHWVNPAQHARGVSEIERLREEGVAVLHLNVGCLPSPVGADLEVAVGDPSEIGVVIGNACEALLREGGDLTAATTLGALHS